MTTRKRPPHVEINTVKGRTYLSFRRGKGPRIPLPGPIGSAEFEAAYAEALAGDVAPKAAKRPAEADGTIGALIARYYKSSRFTNLRETSKAGYQSRLEMLREAHGHRRLDQMTAARIEEKILEPLADRPGQALSILKVLRVLIRYANHLGLLSGDPSFGIKRPKTKEVRAWTEEEIAQFEARWPIGTRERLAFALFVNLGQRRSDIHRLTWRATSLASVTLTQQKTGVALVIPIHPELQKCLQVAPRDHVTILNTAFGKPFTVDGFSDFMRDAITAAGLPLECQPHGLRKAAGRRLAEAGATTQEIMAILGHKSLSEAERYTRGADQKALAKSGVQKLNSRRGEP
jgi:integrase